jgi:hypothetical protein
MAEWRPAVPVTREEGAAIPARPGALRAARASGSSGIGGGADAGSGGRAVRLLLSLARLEGAWLSLSPLALRHPLVDAGGLAQLLSRHYTPAAMLQLAVALGSLDIFGGRG